MSWEEPNDSSCWFFFGDNEVMKMNMRPKKRTNIPENGEYGCSQELEITSVGGTWQK